MSNVQKKKTRKRSARKGSSQNNNNLQMGNGPVSSIPLAIASKQTNKKPKIKMLPNGEARVRHRELILNLTGSLEWEVQATFPINPGQSITFPWLSKTFGRGYEQYCIHDLKFQYISRCGATVPGSTSIIPDYDPSDAAPVTEFIASTYQNTVEDAVWKNITCKLDPIAMRGGRTRHFTRTQPVGSQQDQKAYDCGQVFIATSDNASDAVAVGKIWVEYDMSFYVPQLPPNGSDEIIGGQVIGSEAMAPSDPFGTPILDSQSVGIAVEQTSSQDFVFINSEGEYLLSGYATGTGFTTGGLSYGPGLTLLGATGMIDATSLYFVATVHIDPGYDLGTNFTYLLVEGSTVTQSRLLIARAPDGSLHVDTLSLPKKKGNNFICKQDDRVIPPKKTVKK